MSIYNTGGEPLGLAYALDGSATDFAYSVDGTEVYRSEGYHLVSILGDSISTFDGYIPSGYPSYYHSTTWGQSWAVADTWWMKVIQELGCSLCINNSAGATNCTDRTQDYNSMATCQHRSAELGNNPDVIIIEIGVNDWGCAISIGNYDISSMNPSDSTTFREAYALMLKRITQNYPNARVICCTILQSEYDGGEKRSPGYNSAGVSVTAYNDEIKAVAAAYGAGVADLENCGITWDNRSSYMIDYNSSTKIGVHPNKSGMALIAACVLAALEDEESPAEE